MRPAGFAAVVRDDHNCTRKRPISAFTPPSTNRCAQVYSRPASANRTGFQIRLTWALISSLLRPRPPAVDADAVRADRADRATGRRRRSTQPCIDVAVPDADAERRAQALEPDETAKPGSATRS